MNTQQEQNVPGQGNTERNTKAGQDQTGQQQRMNTEREGMGNEEGDPSQTGTIPSDVETEEALEQDNLQEEDSSLEPDTPGMDDPDDQELNQDDAVPG